jgi:protein involved in polysaccharide export with SLBB domain
MANPQVDVVVEEGRAFRYTIYGFVTAPGVFTLQDPNLRLIDALAIAGGIQPTTERLFIIREVPLTDDVKPEFERDEGAPDAAPADESQPVDIEELIEQLDQDPGGVNPGAFRPQDDAPAEPPALRPIGSTQPPVVDVDDLPGNPDHEFVYIEELDRWVRTRSATDPVSGGAARELIVERIIEIPYQRLSHGDSSYNIVVRANDRIFVDGPPQGVIYIDGEIARPGVYNLPQTGRLTLSRLVAAAGGFGQLAVPTRVDLTRIVGDGHEATVRLNMSAIRQRTEPDLYLKADDHIIIGTTFWATPLAVVRNGLRATYGFGFLLDRNFGNDVFGAPPSDNNRF